MEDDEANGPEAEGDAGEDEEVAANRTHQSRGEGTVAVGNRPGVEEEETEEGKEEEDHGNREVVAAAEDHRNPSKQRQNSPCTPPVHRRTP